MPAARLKVKKEKKEKKNACGMDCFENKGKKRIRAIMIN